MSAEETDWKARAEELEAALSTQREQTRTAQENLRELEERHRLLIEGVRDYAILLLDPTGLITAWNEGAERLLGYAAEEAIGRYASLTFTPEDIRAGKPQRELETARSAGTAVDENWAVRKDGTRFWASGTTMSVSDPRLSGGFVKIFRDLTERDQAQEALRQSEERLRAALSAARMGTWRWDIPADRDTLDEPLCRLLGVDGEHVQTLADFLALIHPEDRPAVAEAFARSAGEGTPLNVEFRVRQPDDSVRWLREQGDVVRGPDGQPLSLTGACVDITERKAMEEDLRRARDDLERRVQERTADLVRAQERALQAERLAAIGQTVATLAHEGRNALQRASACLERLSWRLQGQEEALDLTARARQALADMERLLDDVRGYAGPIQPQLRPCDLADVWRQAWEQVLAQHPDRNAQLRESVEGAALCEADPFRLLQVFHNVFDNALAAGSGEGPVLVEVDCRPISLDGKEQLRVAVRDNGPGLGPGQREHLFVPFYTTKPKGTGLGLALALRIVEAHGGQIAAGAGPGAEIVFTLPRHRV